MFQDKSVSTPTAGVAKHSRVFWALATVWIVAVVAGLSVLWAYENTPGAAADAPAQWPAGSALSRATRADAGPLRPPAVCLHARESR